MALDLSVGLRVHLEYSNVKTCPPIPTTPIKRDLDVLAIPSLVPSSEHCF